jgi:hypothetical protein
MQGRKGVFIAVGATKGSDLFDGSKLTIKYFFDAIGFEYAGELFVWNVDEQGAVRKHPTAMADAYELGKKIAGR